jgi:hypothetical protein
MHGNIICAATFISNEQKCQDFLFFKKKKNFCKKYFLLVQEAYRTEMSLVYEVEDKEIHGVRKF